MTPGRTGHDAFVLDATLALGSDLRQTKARYLNLLEFASPMRIAGVPVRHPPLRAWSVAPLRRPLCDLLSVDGQSGTIPLEPPPGDDRAMRAWLEDVLAHVLAWGGRTEALAPAPAEHLLPRGA
ncbi:MAG: hypothetical protein AB1726_15940 [Planctomycetota bacterium]